MPSRSPRRGLSGTLAVLVAAMALAVGACQSTGRANATPADNAGLLDELARHGVRAVDQRSGDTGCGEASLQPNAVHWRLTVVSDAAPRDVYLFRFRNHAAFEAAAAAVDACRSVFQDRPDRAGGEIGSLAISPWRAFGDGWSSELRDALSASLTLAAGNGGLPPP